MQCLMARLWSHQFELKLCKRGRKAAIESSAHKAFKLRARESDSRLTLWSRASRVSLNRRRDGH